DDAVAAYRFLLEGGIAASRVVIAGDSAGGGLTVAALLALRDRGLPRPAGGACISPRGDLTCSGATYPTQASLHPIVTPGGGAAVGAGRRSKGAARLAALRRSRRPAAAAGAGRQCRGLARRRRRSGRACPVSGRGRHARGVAGHDPRVALVPADAGRGRARDR